MMKLHGMKLMTILTEDANTDALVKKIAKLTDGNMHTLALLELAKFLKEKKYVTILTGIEAIHDAEGSLPMKLSEYRHEIGKKLWAIAAKKLDSTTYKKLESAF